MVPLRIVGFDHVQVTMPAGGAEAARGFYAGVLGLREVERPAGLTAGGVWFGGGGIQVHLGVEEDFRPGGKAHPAFLVSDLEACRRALEAAGAEVVDSSRAEVARLHARDPFGNRLEFIQDGEGFSQCEARR